MRACHPDVAGASISIDEEDIGADDVCVFINTAVMEVGLLQHHRGLWLRQLSCAPCRGLIAVPPSSVTVLTN